MVEKQKLFELAQRNTFAKQIGIELTDVEEGYAKGRIRLAQENMNVYGRGCMAAAPMHWRIHWLELQLRHTAIA